MTAEPRIQCVEESCLFAANPLGQRVCIQCETPLPYRYLWAVGEHADHYSVGTILGDHYYVAAPRTWLNLRPAAAPKTPTAIPVRALPYLKAHFHRFHVPGLHDIWYGDGSETSPNDAILLLDNVPFDLKGHLRPALYKQWPGAPAVRQVHWLWQMLELWFDLADLQLSESVLNLEGVRVDGWRLRLCELVPNPTADPIPLETALKILAEHWTDWIPQAQAAVMQPLQSIVDQMKAGQTSLEQVRRQLNHLLLEQAAQLPLRLTVSGTTDTGKLRSRNEDCCYPDTEELKLLPPDDPARVPQLAIVCDGIGGHEGGEVASQMAVRSLRPQMQALLKEIAEQPDLVSPDTIISQIEASIRVVNNLIDFQNNAYGRAERQRMGTTLVMALVVPQRIQATDGWRQTHELYLASVGDSRAYWITPNGCHLLTVDDVIASRETQAGRALYAAALQKENAEALTQALGTRDADFLHPHIQRLILDEDGVLLLCSDGLSDGNRVEQSWARFIGLISKEMVPLESVVNSWIDLADEKNGHDNIAVVLMHYQTGVRYPGTSLPATAPEPVPEPPESELTEASRALLYGEAGADEEVVTELNQPVPPAPQRQLMFWVARIAIALLVTILVGTIAWWQLNRSTVDTDDPGSEPTSEVTE